MHFLAVDRFPVGATAGLMVGLLNTSACEGFFVTFWIGCGFLEVDGCELAVTRFRFGAALVFFFLDAAFGLTFPFHSRFLSS